MRLSKDSLDLLLWAVAAVTVTCTSPYLCIARRSCGSHMVVLFFGFLGDHVSRKMGNTHGPLTSPRPLFSQFVGSPRLTVPLLQWLALKSPDDVTKPGWTHKGATKSNKDPNSICCMTRAKLRAISQFPRFLIRNSVVIKWDRNGEKRQKEREKSSLYVRYNKKGSSNWGLKPPVVRSVHFSNRGGTHCLLCAQRMAHTKNTHQCGGKLKRTHFNTETQRYTSRAP